MNSNNKNTHSDDVTGNRWNWKYTIIIVCFFIFVILVGILKLYIVPSLSDREKARIKTDDIPEIVIEEQLKK